MVRLCYIKFVIQNQSDHVKRHKNYLVSDIEYDRD